MISRVAFIRMKTGEELLSFEYETAADVKVTFETWRRFKEALDLGDDVKLLVTNSPKNLLGEKLDALIREVRNIKEKEEAFNNAFNNICETFTRKSGSIIDLDKEEDER